SRVRRQIERTADDAIEHQERQAATQDQREQSARELRVEAQQALQRSREVDDEQERRIAEAEATIAEHKADEAERNAEGRPSRSLERMKRAREAEQATPEHQREQAEAEAAIDAAFAPVYRMIHPARDLKQATEGVQGCVQHGVEFDSYDDTV